MTKDRTFYAMLSHGLASVGFAGDEAFNLWLDKAFANKYNAQSYSQLGFRVRPDFKSEYTQVEGLPSIHSIATYVDIDSQGMVKSIEGLKVDSGDIPVFKHELNLTRRLIEEQSKIVKRIGHIDDGVGRAILDLSYKGVDTLLGGNYNTIKRQRHQIVSTGKLTISKENNPLGIQVEYNFLKNYSKNIKTSKWYRISGSSATQETPVTNGTVNPIKVVKDLIFDATYKDFAPKGHLEMSKRTWDILKDLPFFREMFVTFYRPDITDASIKKAYGNMVPDDKIKEFLEKSFDAKIVVIDSISRIEKFDKSTGELGSYLNDFEDGVIAYVPDGEIGEIQFDQPMSLNSDATRVAYHDGGRTMLRFIHNDLNQRQTIESEVRALVVPDKARWMYILKIA